MDNTIMIIYTVWTDGGGDMFKGYTPKYISTHIDRRVAIKVADLNSGWFEEENENLHPDYEETLREQDINLHNAQQRINQSVRDMLTYGG